MPLVLIFSAQWHCYVGKNEYLCSPNGHIVPVCLVT